MRLFPVVIVDGRTKCAWDKSNPNTTPLCQARFALVIFAKATAEMLPHLILSIVILASVVIASGSPALAPQSLNSAVPAIHLHPRDASGIPNGIRRSSSRSGSPGSRGGSPGRTEGNKPSRDDPSDDEESTGNRVPNTPDTPCGLDRCTDRQGNPIDSNGVPIVGPPKVDDGDPSSTKPAQTNILQAEYSYLSRLITKSGARLLQYLPEPTPTILLAAQTRPELVTPFPEAYKLGDGAKEYLASVLDRETHIAVRVSKAASGAKGAQADSEEDSASDTDDYDQDTSSASESTDFDEATKTSESSTISQTTSEVEASDTSRALTSEPTGDAGAAPTTTTSEAPSSQPTSNGERADASGAGSTVSMCRMGLSMAFVVVIVAGFGISP